MQERNGRVIRGTHFVALLFFIDGGLLLLLDALLTSASMVCRSVYHDGVGLVDWVRYATYLDDVSLRGGEPPPVCDYTVVAECG